MSPPNVVYVQVYENDGAVFILADDSLVGAMMPIDDAAFKPGERVGIYKLERIVRLVKCETIEVVPVRRKAAKREH